MSNKYVAHVLVLVAVFAVATLGQFLAVGGHIFTINWNDGKVILDSGVVAVVTTLLAWLTPFVKVGK